MQDLVPIVRRVMEKEKHEHVEIEWRIGHRLREFRPGVDREAWCRLREALACSPAFTAQHTTSVEYFSRNNNAKCIDESRWILKDRVADELLDIAGHPWSVRVCVSRELPVSKPQHAGLEFERRKERWSYVHGPWRVDLTTVFSNLPSHQDEDGAIYEIEVELVDPELFYERPIPWVLQWGLRIVHELCGLMKGPS